MRNSFRDTADALEELGELMFAYASIRASCPLCGDVMLTINEVHVFVGEALDSDGTYSFQCPLCSQEVNRPAEISTIKALLCSGVLYTVVSTELAEHRGSGPPIDHDEILDFHNLLQDDEAVAAFFPN